MNWVLLHTLNCQALTTDMFDLCSQIKYLPQPIQSHTTQIISRCMLCMRCSGCYGCLFLLNLLTRPRPQSLEEPGVKRERLGVKRRADGEASHLGVSGSRMTLLSDLHCVHFRQPRVSIHRRRLQRKGVNCKPFHANFQTHFLHTQSKIIHGICSIFSYAAGTRPYSNQNTKRFQFGSVAFSVLLNTTKPRHLPLFLPIKGESLATGTEPCKHEEGDNNRV